jgi:outer membrane lipoprotein-sorting protein
MGEALMKISMTKIAMIAVVALGANVQIHAQDLPGVLAKLDAAAANFKGATADFEWDTYQKIVNDVDKQYGNVAFKRQGSGTEMRADISDTPGVKVAGQIIIFTKGELEMFEPGTDQEKIYAAGKNAGVAETFLTLGFGGSGTDLKKNWSITPQGTDNIDGVAVTKLDLMPKDAGVAKNLKHVTIWLDLNRGVSLKQQFFYPSGDNKTALYKNIQLSNVDEGKFKMPLKKSTKVDHVQ